MALEDQIKEVKQGKWLSIMLGIISALMIVIMLALCIWYIISPLNKFKKPTPIQLETEIKWNTEHTEKY